MQRGQHKNDVFLLSGHDGNKKVGRFWQKNGFWAKNTAFPARNSALFYATAMRLGVEQILAILAEFTGISFLNRRQTLQLFL